ncbi:uncharacterized protein BJX67DRAFT_42162 [Aspergillus lucknowensis]|uniref:Uncharacterized protein n=1 Tax=Aspergillus lucknowensis TaxID=176173 RepID=A0ABR4LVR2_9EURO
MLWIHSGQSDGVPCPCVFWTTEGSSTGVEIFLNPNFYDLWSSSDHLLFLVRMLTKKVVGCDFRSFCHVSALC